MVMLILMVVGLAMMMVMITLLSQAAHEVPLEPFYKFCEIIKM